MTERNAVVVRSLHDLGLAVWFGGSLAGAVAVNGAAADVPDPHTRLRVANAGWDRWTPVNAAAIAAHLIGGAGLLQANKRRVAAQSGVGSATVVKLVLTGAALAVTAYSRALGKKLQRAEWATSVDGATDPAPGTPLEVAKAQQRLDTCQWLVPALTGGISVMTAVQGEQQRPLPQAAGILARAAQWLRAAG
jgi:hypothetical protein